MTYSIIQKLQLEGALRLDAEYYQPEFLEIEKQISSIKNNFLKNISDKVFSGPFGSTLKSDSYQSAGIPFIRIGDIKDIFINKSNLVYLSAEEHGRIFSTHLDVGDIVLSKIGTVGKLSVISDDLGESNISENNIGIRFGKILEPQKIYILLFLLSKYGQRQIVRKASGNIQLKLNVFDIASIRIPVASDFAKKELLDLYLKLVNYSKESIQFYKQAEDLLLKELGISELDEKSDLFSIVNFSDVQKSNRIDPEYFQEKYNRLFEKISSQNFKKLGDLVSMEKGFEPGAEAYQEEGNPFIRVSNLTKLGLNDGNQQYLGKDLYNKLKMDFEPKIGEILLSKDATPGISYVIKEQIEGIISSGILRLKVNKEIDSEYLSLVISSIIGQMQAERDAGGSIMAHWKPEQIKNILIPILPKEIQEKIADLVKKSHEARKKSKELLEEAKRRVEEMIEKGE